MFGYGGGVLTLDPCTPGTLYLGTANIDVPGTGTFPEKVSDFKWLVPSGWTVQGQTSDGSTWISSGQNVTVTYPASATEGSISVKGYHVVSGCGDLQESLPMDAVTVKRDGGLTLSANKSYLLCGETNPVTFTVTPALPCAVYYWNNSQTPSTNNSFQITPDGSTNVIATVNIVYGGKTKTLQKNINYQLFAPGVYPTIQGDNTVCNGSATYTVSNLRPGYNVTYTKSSNLSISQTSNECTLSLSGGGTGWLEANISTNCGNHPLTLHKEIAFGKVDENKVVSSRYGQADGAWAQYRILCNSGYTTAVAGYDSNGDGEPIGDIGDPLSQSITAYDWSFPSGWSYSSTGSGIPNERIQVSPSYYPSIGQIIQVGVRAQNGCGWTNWKYDNWQVVACGSYRMSISPNPATSEATIELNSNSEEKITLAPEWDLEVYSSGMLLKTKNQKIKSETLKLNTQGWKEGVYIVRAIIGKDVVTGKLVVKP